MARAHRTDQFSVSATRSGVDDTVTRTGIGEYTAILTGIGREEGNFQVTGQGEVAACTIARWVRDGRALSVEVQCYGTGGAAIDSGFLVSYNFVQ